MDENESLRESWAKLHLDARAQILQQVEDLARAEPRRIFIPGVTYIPASGKVVGGEEMRNGVAAVLDGWFTEGNWTTMFETAFERWLGVRRAAFCNSGSSANLLAMAALTSKRTPPQWRLEPGDEVVTAATGFPTTLNAILQAGLKPVFVDVQLGTYVPSAEAILDALRSGPRVRAVFMAHTLGNPVPLDVIMPATDALIVEDNCDSLGSLLGGKKTGTFGVAATQSFYPAHHITTGEGGMVVTDHPALHKVIESFRDWGRDCAVAGEKVKTELSLTAVEALQVGDRVVDGQGQMRRVLGLTGHLSRPTVLVKATLRPQVRVSSGHPFLALRGGVLEWVKALDLRVGDKLVEALPTAAKTYPTVTWRYATAYKKVERELVVEPDLMRLMGYWAAEGRLAVSAKRWKGYRPGARYLSHRVDFSLGGDEMDMAEDIRVLMQTFFGLRGNLRRGRGGRSIGLHFKSRSAYEFMAAFIGRGAPHKRLPIWATILPREAIVQFMRGYWAGDGHVGRTSLVVHSTSECLIEQVRQMLLGLGVVASQWQRRSMRPMQLNGNWVRQVHPLHALSVYGRSAALLAGALDVPWRRTGRPNKAECLGGFAYYPVESVVPGEAATVYNLEVEGSHTYHLGGFVSHNCWCAPGKENTCGKRFAWEFEGLPAGYDHKYVYSEIGYNLKATDMQAAIGCAQLARLDGFVSRRRSNFRFLLDGLADMQEHFILPQPTQGADPAWFGFPITLRNGGRRDVISFLESRRIGTRLLFAGNLLRQPAYQDMELSARAAFGVFESLPNADRITEDTFWVGCWPGLTTEMLTYIVESLHAYYRGDK